MGTEVAVPQNFEDRMRARIRESIGELITDEELSALVKRGVDDIFFKPTAIRHSHWETKEGPSLLHGLVKELLEPTVRSEADKWLKAHHDEVLNAVTATLQEGMGMALVKGISSKFNDELFRFEQEIKSKLSG